MCNVDMRFVKETEINTLLDINRELNCQVYGEEHGQVQNFWFLVLFGVFQFFKGVVSANGSF